MIISHEIAGEGLVAPCFRYDPEPPQTAQVPGGSGGDQVLLLKHWRHVHAAMHNPVMRDLGAVPAGCALAGVTLQGPHGLLRRSGPAARTILNPTWRRRCMEELRPGIRALALRHARVAWTAAHGDLVSGFAVPYIRAVTELATGLSSARRLGELSDQTTGALLRSPADHGPVLAAWDQLYELTGEHVARLWTRPQDTPVGRSVTALREAGMSRPEARETVTTIYNGLPTALPALVRTLEYLLQIPPALEVCASRRDLLAGSVTSALRASAHFTFALPGTATAAFELDGQRFPAGTVVLPVIHAAHRDPSFPIRLHMAWGAGLHACLGRHLGTIILEEGVAAVAARSPRPALYPDELDWQEGTMPVPRALPVLW